MIVVYNFPRGLRGLRVCWLCEELEVPYRVVPVSYPPSEEYRRLHPLGSVPFLEDEGGVALAESTAMLLYVARAHAPTRLLPDDPPALARVLELTVFGETELGANMNSLIAAHFMASPVDKHNWSVRGLESRVDRAFGYLNSWLAAGPYLVGSELTLADISVSCALGLWTGALGKALPPVLAEYRARLEARPAYERARERNAAAPPT